MDEKRLSEIEARSLRAVPRCCVVGCGRPARQTTGAYRMVEDFCDEHAPQSRFPLSWIQFAELDSLDLVAEVRHWREVAHTAAVEVARRGAIIKGSRRPPTDEEIGAHRAAGGAWLVTYTASYAPGEKFAEVFDDQTALHGLRAGDGGLRGIHWRPVTGDGCPCEWPVIEQVNKE